MTKIKLAAFSDEISDSLLEQISGLKKNGVGLIELRSIKGKNISTFSEKECSEYVKIIDGEGVKVWSIGSPLGKVDVNIDFENYKDTVKRICEIACIFNTDKIRMFSFFNAIGEREKVLSYLQEMVEIANSYNVRLYHENEKGIYGDTLERVLDIMNNVKGLKYIYDPANYLQVGEIANKTINTLVKKTDYFHIKDVISQTEELVPAGYGDGKIDEMINQIDFDTTLTLEPHLAVFSSFKDIDDSQMKHKFKFLSGLEAFTCAVDSLKTILQNCGYKEQNGVFIK